MANLKHLALALLVVIGLVVVVPKAEAALSCNDVTQSLIPCLGYMQQNGMIPLPAQCCGGIKSLYSKAKTTQDRQSVCSCLKTLASNVPPSTVHLAAGIPGKCGVTIPYKIDPSVNCATIH